MLFKNNLGIFNWHESDHVFACSKLMDIYGIKYTNKLKVVVSKHYKYPSLQSVCDCLTEYGIKNVAVSLDKTDLENLPVNTIIHSSEQTNEKLSILSGINGRRISLIERGRSKRSYDLEEFRKAWTGVAILTESTLSSREEGYRNNLISSLRTKLGFSAGIFLLFLFLLFTNITNEVLPVILLNTTVFLQIAGAFFTGLLVMRNFKSDNGIVNSLCRFTDSDCDKVLSGKHADIFGVISWAEAGFFYFLCNLFFISFFRDSLLQNLLYISSILTVPIILFSLYYQWRIIKEWCIICIVIQGLLLIQFLLIVLFGRFQNIEFDNSNLILLLYSVLIPFFLLVFVIPLISKATLSNKLNAKIQTFQRSSEYFKGHLMSTKKVGSSAGFSPIVVGNEHSKRVITYVTNPKCSPCKAAHREIRNILSLFGDDIRIEIFFLIGTEFRRSKAYQISAYLINKYYKSPAFFWDALDKWYTDEGRRMVEDEIEKDMAATLYEEADVMLSNHLNWCNTHEIKFTPSVYFLNGRLNDSYPVENLKYQLAQW